MALHIWQLGLLQTGALYSLPFQTACPNDMFEKASSKMIGKNFTLESFADRLNYLFELGRICDVELN